MAGDAVRQDTHVKTLVHEPIRTCVGCRERCSRSELLRVVAIEADGILRVVPDPRRRLPGRGAWLHCRPQCLALAERRRAFPRALRRTGQPDTAAVRDFVVAPRTNET